MGSAPSMSLGSQPVSIAPMEVKNTTVRERLKEEFGEKCDDRGGESTQGPSNVRLSELPGVFKARAKFLKPIRLGRQAKSTNVLKKPDKPALVKELYRRMDPSVISHSQVRVTGEIQLSVKYRNDTGNLLLKIGTAKDLKLDNAFKLPDPYVTVELIIPSCTRGQVRRTKQKWNTSNPVFQEILAFNLPSPLLVESKLKVSVRSKDKISEDDFLGEVVLEMSKLDLTTGLLDWYSLHPATDLSISGSIDVSIKHTMPHKLTVTIYEARSLKAIDQEKNTSNPFVRCLITGIETRFCTEVMQETINPVFDTTFEFKLHREELQYKVLAINVLSREKLGKKCRRLGDVHIALSEIPDGILERTTFDLKDLRNAPHAIQQWTDEGVAAEFREALRAHIVYQFPNFLFREDQKGKKCISVTSTKAKTSAKVVINNGLPQS